jgi:hypothetical protein
MNTKNGRMMEILKNLIEKDDSGDTFVIDWFTLFPWSITNKDLKRILTDYIENRIENAKRI